MSMFWFVPYFLPIDYEHNEHFKVFIAINIVHKDKYLKFLSISIIETASFWVYLVTLYPKLMICYLEFF